MAPCCILAEARLGTSAEPGSLEEKVCRSHSPLLGVAYPRAQQGYGSPEEGSHLPKATWQIRQPWLGQVVLKRASSPRSSCCHLHFSSGKTEVQVCVAHRSAPAWPLRPHRHSSPGWQQVCPVLPSLLCCPLGERVDWQGGGSHPPPVPTRHRAMGCPAHETHLTQNLFQLLHRLGSTEPH
jgi:hypothetical protein